jgi:hypothetical protein
MAGKSGRAWTIEEDERLRKMIISGVHLVDIAMSLGRTEKATQARAYSLRLLLRRIGVRRRSPSRWS